MMLLLLLEGEVHSPFICCYAMQEYKLGFNICCSHACFQMHVAYMHLEIIKSPLKPIAYLLFFCCLRFFYFDSVPFSSVLLSDRDSF